MESNKDLFNKFENHQFSMLDTARVIYPLFLSALVGLGAGLLAVALIRVIHYSEWFFFGYGRSLLGSLGSYAVVLVPAVGGLLVGVLVNVFAPETKGHGVPEVMKSIAIGGGKIRSAVIWVKMLASSISIGSGASVGREGPAVHIGSAFGSLVSKIGKLNSAQTKNLVACGAAGGIAAVFNAPLAGFMFALEVIMRDFGGRSLSTVVLASLSGSIVSRALVGKHPAFMAPAYGLQSAFEIPLYLILGVLSAFVALLFIVVLDRSEDFFSHTKLPKWLKPALGGVAVGCIGLFVPQVFGSGLEPMQQMLTGRLDLGFLFMLVFLKIAATSLSLGTGSSGGTFAPTLFVGAALGGAFGKLFFNHVPFAMAPPGAYALVGMASVFAGATHAPVTAILLVFEVTGDYKLILPIMATVVAATSITQFIRSESIDTVNLKRMGIDIRLLQETKFLSAVHVGDAMTSGFMLIPQRMGAQELVKKIAEERDKIFFVTNGKKSCIGSISLDVMRDILFEKDISALIAHDLMTPIHETVFPNDSLSEAANIMTQHNLQYLPVVDPADGHRIVGVLKPSDFHHAFTHITLKQAELVKRLERESSQAGGIRQHVFRVPHRSLLIGKKIKELGLPKGVMFTSIERNKEPIVPTGDTALAARDRVWIAVTRFGERDFRYWLDRHQVKLL